MCKKIFKFVFMDPAMLNLFHAKKLAKTSMHEAARKNYS